MFVLGYRCTICGREYAYEKDMLTCPACGETGILDIVFDYRRIKEVFTRKRFYNDRTDNIWRYRALLPVEGENEAQFLRVGFSPLYRSNRLEKELKAKAIYIKDDGVNPTGSLKDRASAVAVMRAMELGYHTIACSSTGNAASSLAGNAARMGLKSVIFVPERAPKGKIAQLLLFGANVISVRGNYRETFELSRAAIERWGFYNRNAAINPVMLEGKKTVALEIAEQMHFHPSDWVALSVGDGCTVGGVYKGFYDLKQLGLIGRIPKILAIQSTGCCPFVDAAAGDGILKEAAENTLADSISVGVPRNPVKALRAVKESGGKWLAVSDEEILSAMRILGHTEGVFAEPAAAAAAAGVISAFQAGIIMDYESVCIISSGSGLKDVNNAMKAAGEPFSCAPDIRELIRSKRIEN
jgi:threonine synthase